jgi:ribosomal protein S18 acetylase RimI-like enzyme
VEAKNAEKILWVRASEIHGMVDREEEGGSSSFLVDQTVGLHSVVIADDNDRLLGYAGYQMLPWDTDVLNMVSGRVGYMWGQGDYLTQRQRLSRLLGVCIEKLVSDGMKFLSTRINCEELAAVHAAEDHGFRVIESYLTFYTDRQLDTGVADLDNRVRLADRSEEAAVSRLALNAFRYNRYMMDPLLPEELARYSRVVWVRNAFAGRAEAIYVAEAGSKIVGFVILRTVTTGSEKKIGLIDLIAVDSAFAGGGIGSALLSQSLHYFGDRVFMVQAGTQCANVSAVNLYKKMGFRYLNCEYSLHWHSSLSGK